LVSMNRDDYKAETLKELKNLLNGYVNLGIDVLEKTYSESGSDSLDNISDEISHCRKCPLGESRKNPVAGEGNPNASLLFVGEAPGYYEDVEGRPFVGKAGQLLTKIIEAMGLKRENVYIGNILKCRPPDNRNPLPLEMDACFPYLERQIKLIKPLVICALGRYAAQTLSGSDAAISRLRGQVFYYKGIKMIPTFHPSYLLRSPKQKRATWEDMKFIMEILKEGQNG